MSYIAPTSGPRLIPPAKPYICVQPLARWLVILLTLHIVLNFGTILLGCTELSTLGEPTTRALYRASDLLANASQQPLTTIVQQLLSIPTAILFIIWAFNGYRNLPTLGARGLSFRPPWVVAGFFIPFVNLAWPYVVVRELWVVSHPDVKLTEGEEWKTARVRSAVGPWWSLYILAGIISRLIWWAVQSTDNLDFVPSLKVIIMLTDLLLIIAAALLITIVKNVSQWQDDKSLDLDVHDSWRPLSSLGTNVIPQLGNVKTRPLP